MAEYILKPGQETFQVVDGPYENRQYLPGVVYADIPPGEEARFEERACGNTQAVVGKKSKADKEAEQ